MVKLVCKYEKYDRYLSGRIEEINIQAPDWKEAFYKLFGMIGLYTEPDDMFEMEEEYGEEFKIENVIDDIDSQNGDGCDFVFYLSVDGKVYIDEQDCFKNKDVIWDEEDECEYEEEKSNHSI